MAVHGVCCQQQLKRQFWYERPRSIQARHYGANSNSCLEIDAHVMMTDGLPFALGCRFGYQGWPCFPRGACLISTFPCACFVALTTNPYVMGGVICLERMVQPCMHVACACASRRVNSRAARNAIHDAVQAAWPSQWICSHCSETQM